MWMGHGKMIKRLSFFVFIAVVFSGCFFCSKTYAASCPIDAWENDALSYACAQSGDGARGAMWISDDWDTYSISTEVVVDDWVPGSGSVSVALHGAIIGGGDAYATYIKFVKENDTIWYTADGYESYAPLSVPSELWRWGNSRYTSAIQSNYVEAWLNVDELIKEEGNNYENEGDYRKYTVVLQAFRCFQGQVPYWGNGACYSDDSTLTVRVKMATEYEGFSYVRVTSDGESKDKFADTDWTSNNKSIDDNTVYLKIDGDECDDGCKVQFWHGVRKKQNSSGNYSSHYFIRDYGASGSWPDGQYECNDRCDYWSEEATVKTGEIVCSALNFSNKVSPSDPNLERTDTRACVYATGSYDSSIDLSALKSVAYYDNETKHEGKEYSPAIILESVSKLFNSKDLAEENWTKNMIYAKPEDKIYFRGSYVPTYQSTTGRITEKARINSGESKNSNMTVREFLNANAGFDWNNAFSIYLENNKNTFSEREVSGEIGKANEYKGYDFYDVDKQDSGNEFYAVAATNHVNSTKTTPQEVSFDYSENPGDLWYGDYKKGEGFTANINTNAKESNKISVAVPYNFTNTTNLNKDFLDEDNALVAYAGEEKSVTLDINVGQRTNNVTDGTYATIVRNAKWRLKVCYTADTGPTCSYTNPNEKDGTIGTLNETGNLNGATDTKKIKFNVPDLPAGSSITIQTEVYPKDSYNDTNLNTSVYDPNDPNSWATSSVYTLTIAKKPSLQVWGGNIYVGSKINTATATKKHLKGYNEYSIEGDYDGKRYVFGSWGELGLIASGSVSGFSSGAALGYASQLSSNSEPGGGTKSDICLRSPLTFANFPCNSQSYQNTVGKLGNSNATNNASDQRTMIKNKMANSEEETAKEDITLDGEVVIKKGETKVYYTTKNVNIKKNLVYENADSGGYETLEDMPKLVIYAEGDINISCDVDRIDGLLIAEGEVNTCAGSDGTSPDVNSSERSNQLTVNGAIVAKKLLANRTYGAATGANSIIPAEIINFDPTLYLFGNSGSGENKSSSVNFDVTYTKELAPRY